MQLELMRDNSKEMPDVADPKAVEHLRVWHCKYRSLADLRSFTGLRVLQIATFPDDSFDLLRPLKRLKYLSIIHLSRVKDLSPLAELKSLEALKLATLPSWDASGKVTEVKSLAPLADVAKLRHLELFGVRPKNKSLRALEACRRLKTARFSKYPKAEVARFYAATGVSDAYIPMEAYGAE